MKKLLQYSILIILTGCVGFVSCKKENPVASVFDPPPPPPPPDPNAITNIQLVEFGNLSKPRYHLLAATAGNKILFVGGRFFVPNAFYDSTDATWWNAEYNSTRVDIYDTSAHTWSIADLEGSNYDAWSGVATVGSKIFFAVGYGYNSPQAARIDIYDAVSNSWSFINLPKARKEIAVASLGDKVFFAGGNGITQDDSRRVDIYDASGNNWTTAVLSQPRTMISGVSFAGKIFFAGGYPLTTRVDIYNGATQSWSTAELSTGKYLMRTATTGNKLLFDVGDGNSGGSVDVYNDSTKSWSVMNVSFPGPPQFRPTASLGSNAFCFVYSSQASIYNSISNTWSIATLTPTNNYGHKAAITVGNSIFLAGGFDGQTNSGTVWKSQF